MKKFILSMAGAAVALASASVLIAYGEKKKADKDPSPAMLATGIVGALAGAAIAAVGSVKLPSRADYELELEDLLDGEDLFLVDESIAEVLGSSSEQTARPAPLRQIELDEEATIEDFI